MAKILSVFILLMPVLSWAAEHAEEGLDGHMRKVIVYQALNIVLLVGGLVYYLREPVKTFFKEKREVYIAAADKAQSARRQAEEEHMHIRVQLTKLESTADETLARARAEAADMRKQMLTEAQEISKRIREDAEMASRLEIEKARASLRQQMISEASNLARQSMKDKVSSEDQSRLQSEFIQNIEAVRS